MTDQQRSNAPALLEPGVRIADRFVVVRTLGEGGMGQVFEVEHEAIGRHFALKILNLNPCNEETLRRFRREVRALGRVTSARVAQVTDFGVEPRLGPYYVMELLEGETLEDGLEREHHLPLQQAIPVAIDLCEALAEVHAAGIIHRDLKPSNVGLTRGGAVRVKLLDFGLAAALDGSELERITRSKEVVGSLPYMAPERFFNSPLTLSIDLYALGVVIYEMLTGELPFDGSNAPMLINQHLNEQPRSFQTAAPGLKLPASLEAVVFRLLDKDPAQRFSTAAAVARALQAATIDAPIPTMAEDAEDPSYASTMAAADGAVPGATSPSTMPPPRPGPPAAAFNERSSSWPEFPSSARQPKSAQAPAGVPTSVVPEPAPSWPRSDTPPPVSPTIAQVGSSVASGGWSGAVSVPPPPTEGDGTRVLRIVAVVVAGFIGSALAAGLAFLILWDEGEVSAQSAPQPPPPVSPAPPSAASTVPSPIAPPVPQSPRPPPMPPTPPPNPVDAGARPSADAATTDDASPEDDEGERVSSPPPRRPEVRRPPRHRPPSSSWQSPPRSSGGRWNGGVIEHPD